MKSKKIAPKINNLKCKQMSYESLFQDLAKCANVRPNSRAFNVGFDVIFIKITHDGIAVIQIVSILLDLVIVI